MIKKILGGILLFSLAVNSIFAQNPVEITGTLKKKKAIPVKLFKVVEGKTVEISNTLPEAKGKFGFIFYPEYEGLYVIGTGGPGSANDNYKFYFKSGDKLSLSILDSSYVLTGKSNTKENVVLTQWHDLVHPVEHKAINFMKTQSTFVDFFPVLEEVAGKLKTFLNGKATGNAKFDRNMKQYMTWDLASYATNFVNTPRSKHPSIAEFSPYYSTLKAQDFAVHTSSIYAYPWGGRSLSGIVGLNMRQQNIKYLPGIEGLKSTFAFIPNDTLKGDVLLDRAANLKSFNDYKEMNDAFGKYLLTASQKTREFEIRSPLLTLKAGEDTYAFSYPDKEGKTVTMASLKGKVVLVDVWATWCGPCKAEIPHLKKLEEEMKGKNVEIISLSTDAVKDREKWLKMIADENLGGTQLFAGGPGNEFSKYYKINTIPRFLLFDKAGKIVNVDSPRPSSPALKELIEKTLMAK